MNRTTQLWALTLVLAASSSVAASAPAKPTAPATKTAEPNLKKKAAPSPRASAAEAPAARECQSYLAHLIDVQATASVAAVREVKDMTDDERAQTLARTKEVAAKLTEAQRELKECLGGKVSRAELDCTLAANNAAAAAECAGL